MVIKASCEPICSLLLIKINNLTLFHNINNIKTHLQLKKSSKDQWMIYSEITSTHTNYVFKKTKFG